MISVFVSPFPSAGTPFHDCKFCRLRCRAALFFTPLARGRVSSGDCHASVKTDPLRRVLARSCLRPWSVRGHFPSSCIASMSPEQREEKQSCDERMSVIEVIFMKAPWLLTVPAVINETRPRSRD